ncbi:hypothetical protein [Cellvibrio sp. UBA7661]|uniref:hypothetical protein n=1 Tax=Cellvibrio sp. UBA7661 TaxID=1946311 RepID=UPI002F357428
MPDKDTTKDQQSNTPSLDRFIWTAIFVFGLCFLLAAIHFSVSSFNECINELENTCENNEWADYRAAWGQFGDFMGGMVNPFLGLLTVYLLVTELRESRSAQERNENKLQTQIDETRSQNNFSNYFVHLEAFKEHTRDTSGSEKVNLTRMHKRMFPNCLNGDYSLSDDFISDFENCRNNVWRNFINIDGKQHDDLVGIIEQIDNETNNFYVRNGLVSPLVHSDPFDTPSHIVKKKGHYPLLADNIPEHIILKVQLLTCCEKAIQFDIEHDSKTISPNKDLCQEMQNYLFKAKKKDWGKIADKKITIPYAFGKAIR